MITWVNEINFVKNRRSCYNIMSDFKLCIFRQASIARYQCTIFKVVPMLLFSFFRYPMHNMYEMNGVLGHDSAL